MAILSLDLGGTKLASAVFTEPGILVDKKVTLLDGRQGKEVGLLIRTEIQYQLSRPDQVIEAIGISVPGISRQRAGTVWAPNIPGWSDYPLLEEVQAEAFKLPVRIDSDRACCILGEVWQGKAQGCSDAIFLSIGTGIGAGILTEGRILRGHKDIAGAIGWMALQKPYNTKFTSCGNFEYYASGEGMVNLAKEIILAHPTLPTTLDKEVSTAYAIFSAHENGDIVAKKIIQECISYWGMACANLISIFNPEKIIFGGGLFGPASQWIEEIKTEAAHWAQPISMQQVSFESSGLSGDSALYGAAFMVINRVSSP